MKQSTIMVVAASLLVGALCGYLIGYLTYQPRISGYEMEIAHLKNRVTEYEESILSIGKTVDELRETVAGLEAQGTPGPAETEDFDMSSVYTDPEETINTEVNQEFDIALSFNLIYLWREKYDETMLSLEAVTFDASPEVKQGKVEVGVSQYFRFRALKRGETEITINLMSVDGKSIVEHTLFKVIIK